ncbi:hypothetical protein MRX96_003640 [Rhipicephalus microplus]
MRLRRQQLRRVTPSRRCSKVSVHQHRAPRTDQQLQRVGFRIGSAMSAMIPLFRTCSGHTSINRNEKEVSSQSEESDGETLPESLLSNEKSLPSEERQAKLRGPKEECIRKVVEATEEAVPEGKRRFRFLLGVAGEERFCVDPKPNRSLLAFGCLPFNELAVFPSGWRCDTIPLEAWGGRRKKVLRYWHPKAFPSSCVANLAQPRLSFAHSERNLVYVPLRDPRALPRTADVDGVDPLRIHDASTRNYLQGKLSL